MTPRARRGLALLAAIQLALAGCVASPTGPSSGQPTPGPEAVRVVTTTTVFADLVERVGGTRVVVTSLVPRGGDVHTFDPTPSAIAAVADAALVIANGLGLDDWLTKLATDAGTKAPIVRLAEDLPGTRLIMTGGQVNPHLWLNVAYARLYVGRIAEALGRADPGDAATFTANATAYDSELAGLDAWVRSQVATIPAANRKLVSFHDAFPYFAAAYGITVVGVLVPAPGQDPSAGEIAALVDAIRASGAKAVFSEAQFNDKLVRAIADEAGARVESNLYDDTLGDPPIDSYEGVIRWDVERLVAALS